jgi:hypothetical protein
MVLHASPFAMDKVLASSMVAMGKARSASLLQHHHAVPVAARCPQSRKMIVIFITDGYRPKSHQCLL